MALYSSAHLESLKRCERDYVRTIKKFEEANAALRRKRVGAADSAMVNIDELIATNERTIGVMKWGLSIVRGHLKSAGRARD